jgi:hypothetical protein
VERALRTPAREQIQQEADRATFERRAVAVENERAISENELESRIELARREEQLVAQQGANARRLAEEESAAAAVRTDSEAARRTTLATAEAEALRTIGAATAAAEADRLAAHQQVDPAVLHALALIELAGNLPKVNQLTLTPDLLTDLLGRLAR